MERREFLTVAGTVAVGAVMRNSEVEMRNGPPEPISHSAFRISRSQNPTLGPQVFAQRISRAQNELKSRNLDLLAIEPSTNFQYFTSYNHGRSERLLLLMNPAAGTQ